MTPESRQTEVRLVAYDLDPIVCETAVCGICGCSSFACAHPETVRVEIGRDWLLARIHDPAADA